MNIENTWRGTACYQIKVKGRLGSQRSVWNNMRLSTVKHAFAVVLFVLLPNSAFAQPFAYVSPGLQIGFTPGEGMFYSVQLTLGYSVYKVDTFPPKGYVGCTLGYRWTKTERMKYLDGQISTFWAGAGWGKVWWDKMRTPNTKKNTTDRFKAWAGLGWYLTYDTYKVKNAARAHNYGIIGVLPKPLLADFTLSS